MPKSYTLRWSIVASFTGQHPKLSEYYPCDTTLADVIRAWQDATGEATEPSEPYDSEYSYLAREGAIPERILDRLEDARGETRYQICRKLAEQYPRESFWASICDIQVSGILDRATLFNLLDSIGAAFENCQTMGTLGGPLAPWGGIVPDFAFDVESQVLFASIRITPILCRRENGAWEPCRAPSEWQWETIAEILRHADIFDLYRHARTPVEATL